MGAPWSDEEKGRAKALRAEGVRSADIAAALNAEFGNRRSVKRVLEILRGVPGAPIGGYPGAHTYTPEEDAVILKHGRNTTAAAAELGLRYEQVHHRKARLLGRDETPARVDVGSEPGGLDPDEPFYDDTRERVATRAAAKRSCDAHLADLQASGGRFVDVDVPEGRFVAPIPVLRADNDNSRPKRAA